MLTLPLSTLCRLDRVADIAPMAALPRVTSVRPLSSDAGKPTTPSPPGPPLPAEVVPVAAEKGASCAAACEAAGRRCAPEHFAALNDCNRLREHYACEAGCEADAPAPEYPAYVDAGAPKAQRPTMCLLLEPTTLAQASCEAANAHVRRLCPCAAVAA